MKFILQFYFVFFFIDLMQKPKKKNQDSCYLHVVRNKCFEKKKEWKKTFPDLFCVFFVLFLGLDSTFPFTQILFIISIYSRILYHAPSLLLCFHRAFSKGSRMEIIKKIMKEWNSRKPVVGYVCVELWNEWDILCRPDVTFKGRMVI